jgi:hypothetical protein
MDASCTVVTVDLFTIDFTIIPTRDGTQVQNDPLAEL